MFEVFGELNRRSLCRGATQSGGARRPCFAALCAQRLVPANIHDLRRQSGFFAHRLADGGEEALAHLGITGLNIQTASLQHADRSMSAIDGAVANAGALDAAADAGVPGALVDILN